MSHDLFPFNRANAAAVGRCAMTSTGDLFAQGVSYGWNGSTGFDAAPTLKSDPTNGVSHVHGTGIDETTENASASASLGYPSNSSGQSYGSSALAAASQFEPDLILTVASNGALGYVSKIELDAADGTSAVSTFQSRQDAQRWSETDGRLDHVIPVYESDGRTVIGDFTILGGDSMDRLPQPEITPPTR